MNKVTLFIPSLSSGGAEHQLAILADLLIGKGYNVEFVTYADIPDHYSLNEKVKRLHISPMKSKWWKMLSIFMYFLKSKTNCVISFGHKNNTIILLPLLFRPKIKVIAGERCLTFPNLTWYDKLNYAFLYHRANYIVSNSVCQLNNILRYRPIYKKKSSVIINYTDTNIYTVNPSQQNDVIKVGIFCRYSAIKNYERFALAVKLMKEKCDKSFHITWYGNKMVNNKPNPEYLHFEHLVNEYKISDVLTLNDHTKDVAALISTFDVLSLPSLAEGFSNSIGEYICCGKPVLCSDVADNSTMVHDYENGFLFDPYNIEDIADSFIRFFNMPYEKQLEMGLNSRKIAEKLFDKDRFVNSYIELIEK